MDNETILLGFVEGFAKTAEAAGFYGSDAVDLMKLAIDLAQREMHKEAFDRGFSEVFGRA